MYDNKIPKAPILAIFIATIILFLGIIFGIGYLIFLLFTFL